jgi:ATP-binding protein involved in chromosome partitioning
VGVIENMSYFQCEHNQKYYLFGKDGGLRLAQTLKVPLLAQLPIDPLVSDNSNISSWHSMHEMSKSQDIFLELANKVQNEFPFSKVEGCTARILSIFNRLEDELSQTETSR